MQFLSIPRLIDGAPAITVRWILDICCKGRGFQLPCPFVALSICVPCAVCNFACAFICSVRTCSCLPVLSFFRAFPARAACLRFVLVIILSFYQDSIISLPFVHFSSCWFFSPLLRFLLFIRSAIHSHCQTGFTPCALWFPWLSRVCIYSPCCIFVYFAYPACSCRQPLTIPGSGFALLSLSRLLTVLLAGSSADTSWFPGSEQLNPYSWKLGFPHF